MQLPSIDRTPHVRQSGADVASAGANRVIPVAPVNPAVQASPPLVVTEASANPPGVVDHINPALKPKQAEPGYASTPDPMRRGSEAATSPKDWTIRRPEKEKVQDPPPKPLYQVLMDHIKQMWTAGASAIQIEQVANQLTPPPQVPPTEAPGTIAKEVLVYQPSKVAKNEKV